jgi:hypothetical protein
MKSKEEIAELCAERLLGNVIDICAFQVNISMDTNSLMRVIRAQVFVNMDEVTEVFNNIGVEKRINVNLHNTNDYYSCWGFIEQYTPSETVEGEIPKGEIVIKETRKFEEPIYVDSKTGKRM